MLHTPFSTNFEFVQTRADHNCGAGNTQTTLCVPECIALSLRLQLIHAKSGMTSAQQNTAMPYASCSAHQQSSAAVDKQA